MFTKCQICRSKSRNVRAKLSCEYAVPNRWSSGMLDDGRSLQKLFRVCLSWSHRPLEAQIDWPPFICFIWESVTSLIAHSNVRTDTHTLARCGNVRNCEDRLFSAVSHVSRDLLICPIFQTIYATVLLWLHKLRWTLLHTIMDRFVHNLEAAEQSALTIYSVHYILTTQCPHTWWEPSEFIKTFKLWPEKKTVKAW